MDPRDRETVTLNVCWLDRVAPDYETHGVIVTVTKFNSEKGLINCPSIAQYDAQSSKCSSAEVLCTY